MAHQGVTPYNNKEGRETQRDATPHQKRKENKLTAPQKKGVGEFPEGALKC